jgi:hypothetical protein
VSQVSLLFVKNTYDRKSAFAIALSGIFFWSAEDIIFCLNTLFLKNYFKTAALKHKCSDSFLSELGSLVVSQEYP